MFYTDTRDSSVKVSFADAALLGMNARTGGLYIPVSYPALPQTFWARTDEIAFCEIAFEAAKLFCADEIPDSTLESIVRDAYPFDAPLVPLDSQTFVLELFHGPTCAFKDFGARFMARVMSYFNRNAESPLHILVATSGDTGSAVGSAFHRVSGVSVTILYPEGKISPLQEKQLSTFTDNVRALKVAGTFDDCQKLVKTAFTDDELRAEMRLSSANSINISRLLPQSFYYISASLALKRLLRDSKSDFRTTMVVPSGNFGNLTSGFIAQKMGAPISNFIAATNANKTIPDWLAGGTYEPRSSIPTLSNAMDVGAPSNYERIATMYSLEDTRKILASSWLSDKETLDAIQKCRAESGYILDPHGAVGWQVWQNLKSEQTAGIVLETAHPAKFSETVEKACGVKPPLPVRLQKVLELPDRASTMPNDYGAFKAWLLDKNRVV